MPKLPNIDDCCGCGACVDICTKDALQLQEDKNGYYNIVVDNGKCVECHQCESKCHILNQDSLNRHDPRKVQPLAGWSTNKEIIKKSATGGMFAQIAYDFLADDNTFVYGASLQEDSSVKHIEISSRDEIYKLQNSKYQQSYSVGIYKQVKSRLKAGARVLFSGVPCQVAALYSYLGDKNGILDKLYTIEVICHGVPTNYLHRLGIKYNKAKRVIAYRNKKNSGWCMGRNNRVVYEMPDGTVKEISNHQQDFLFRSYLSFSFSFSRKNCYSCKYSALKRVSDMTIGDFWGFEKSDGYAEYGNFMGTSAIFPNTEKGKYMIAQSDSLNTMSAKWEDILPLNQNLYMPTNRYILKGYDKVATFLRLPSGLCRFLFMNGFRRGFFNNIYMRFFNLVTKKKQAKAYSDIDKMCQKALDYIYSDNKQ